MKRAIPIISILSITIISLCISQPSSVKNEDDFCKFFPKDNLPEKLIFNDDNGYCELWQYSQNTEEFGIHIQRTGTARYYSFDPNASSEFGGAILADIGFTTVEFDDVERSTQFLNELNNRAVESSMPPENYLFYGINLTVFTSPADLGSCDNTIKPCENKIYAWRSGRHVFLLTSLRTQENIALSMLLRTIAHINSLNFS